MKSKKIVDFSGCTMLQPDLLFLPDLLKHLDFNDWLDLPDLPKSFKKT